MEAPRDIDLNSKQNPEERHAASTITVMPVTDAVSGAARAGKRLTRSGPGVLDTQEKVCAGSRYELDVILFRGKEPRQTS